MPLDSVSFAAGVVARVEAALWVYIGTCSGSSAPRLGHDIPSMAESGHLELQSTIRYRTGIHRT
jgi:hypothetical protein